ncbi:MAG: LysR family transcriptional regulator [Actinobacteria bacterium]|nr:MAG: LysR family transcriptional regulator [Actinomycetota bacterium]
MYIDPRRLPILLAVRREGGIVAAADILHFSPSAISQQIQKLEDEIGLELIERTPSGSILTPAGQILSEAAERIESELTETLRTLSPLAGHVTGIVTIGSFSTLITSALTLFHSEISRELPGIDLRFVEVEETPGMTALRAGRLDILALERDTTPPSSPRGYTDVPLLDEPWMLITPPQTPAISSESDLAALNWLHPPTGTAGHKATLRLTTTIDTPLWSEHRYTDYSVAISMVAAGLGSTVLPSLALSDTLSENVNVTPLPTLGVRRILLRHHASQAQPDSPVGQVLDRLSRWVTEHQLPWGPSSQ